MSSPRFHRERTKEQLVKEIGWIVSRKIRDPRVPSMVSVTDIELTRDLRNATVFISVYGEHKDRTGALIALNHAAPYVQKLLGSRISLKHMPKLVFKEDRSLDYSERINELLKEVQDDLR